MVKVTFISAEGEVQMADGDYGVSVMETAKRHGVEGIVGECGGACACATCHVYIDAAWRASVGEASPDESDMLDFVRERRPESRLSCQIRLNTKLNGLVVTTPARQG